MIGCHFSGNATVILRILVVAITVAVFGQRCLQQFLQQVVIRFIRLDAKGGRQGDSDMELTEVSTDCIVVKLDIYCLLYTSPSPRD